MRLFNELELINTCLKVQHLVILLCSTAQTTAEWQASAELWRQTPDGVSGAPQGKERSFAWLQRMPAVSQHAATHIASMCAGGSV